MEYSHSSEIPKGSVVEVSASTPCGWRHMYATPPIMLQVTIELSKVPGGSFGFRITGGRGSTPTYGDVDDVRLK